MKIGSVVPRSSIVCLFDRLVAYARHMRLFMLYLHMGRYWPSDHEQHAERRMKREKLIRARIKKGLSQEAAAGLMGVSRNAWSLWELGKEDPYPLNVGALCTFFGVKDPSELDLEPPQLKAEKAKEQSTAYPLATFTPSASSTHAEILLVEQENSSSHVSSFPAQETREETDLFSIGILALTLHQQQKQWSITELEQRVTQALEEQKEKAVSRRDVLVLLTGMSGALLGLNNARDTKPILAEEALSLCLTAIPACWSLVYTGGIEYIEQVLPSYLTHLTSIAQRSSHYQMLVANLASQAYKLANLLALRREDFIAALKYSKDALIYGQLAGDLNLQLAALIEEALTFWYRKRPQQTLETYQRALQLIPRRGLASGIHNIVSPIIAGRVYVGLAEAHAQLEQEQEALQYMGLAQDTFPGDPENDPHFAYTHYDHYYLYLYQGLMYMKLNQPNQALSAYAHFDAPQYVPRRAEITNREAAALLALGDMDQCYGKVESAVALAISMSSDLRYSEAQEVYQGMLIKWPHERKVKSLVQIFQR